MKGILLPKQARTKFTRGTLYDYSCTSTKNALMERTCKFAIFTLEV